MASIGGTVKVNIVWTPGVGFIYQETENDTGGAVEVNAGKRLFKVFRSGTYQLVFTAKAFTLADPPIGFPEGKPPFFELLPGYTDEKFTLLNYNSGTVENEMGSFLVHRSDGTVVDPTVVNNPNPPDTDFPWDRLPEHAYCRHQVQP